MSETPFPNPRTTKFNPEAWDTPSAVSEDEIAFLDNYFVRFPEAQSTPITFPISPTVPTLPFNTSDTQAASAQFVQNAKGSNVWGALQTFNAGMVSNAINPLTTGGTLLIGNGSVTNNIEVASTVSRSAILHLGDGNNSTGAVNIGNGTSSSNAVNILNGTGSTGTINLGSATSTISLGAPLTPAYLYTGTGTAAGKIGEVITNSGGATNTINGITNVFSISVPAGVWIFNGKGQFPLTAGMAQLGFGTSATPVLDATIIQDVVYTNNQINGCPSPTAVIVNTVTTTWFLVANFTVAGNQNLAFPRITATRLA